MVRIDDFVRSEGVSITSSHVSPFRPVLELVAHLQAIRHVAPSTVFVRSVSLFLAAVAAAADHQWLGVVDWHFCGLLFSSDTGARVLGEEDVVVLDLPSVGDDQVAGRF